MLSKNVLCQLKCIVRALRNIQTVILIVLFIDILCGTQLDLIASPCAYAKSVHIRGGNQNSVTDREKQKETQDTIKSRHTTNNEKKQPQQLLGSNRRVDIINEDI